MTEWKTSVVRDAWLECENDTWVRWSEVKAVTVRQGAKEEYDSAPRYQVIFVLATSARHVYITKPDKSTARQTVVTLLQGLSNDFRQEP
jgi:hypothetical protein